MKIKFLGAAGNVTGSRFLLETGGKRLLVDCGLYQERDLSARNWDAFPVEPASLDTVLLTHAHLDHSGYLPKLVQEGFKGEIYCTEPTSEITRIALLDSAHLQEADAEFKKKRHRKEKRKGPYPEIPLYTVSDAEKTFSRLKPIPYLQPVSLAGDMTAVFHDAGHILGAAMIELRVRENKKEKICVFSGDIGRWDRPILRDPSLFDHADIVCMESTYGNRVHETQDVSLEKFRQIILDTYERGGNVVIPTFAIERAQEVLYYLSQLLEEDKIPPLVVFLDSPMAIEVTGVFKRYSDYFDREARARSKGRNSPFEFSLLKTTRTTAESKAINHIKGTSIIMAGSGMCTGGRIKHHLLNNIRRKESTILFVGYQARGTLGRIILERPSRVRILGQTFTVQARIEKINGFSAHADKNELLKWVSGFKKDPEKIFIVHGEESVSLSFAETLRTKVNSEVVVPAYLDEYEI